MRCENIFCVYNHNDECVIDRELDIMGRCRDCIYVSPDPEYLRALKIKILRSWGDDDLAETYYKNKKQQVDAPDSATTPDD